jgi:hypothetical protein
MKFLGIAISVGMSLLIVCSCGKRSHVSVMISKPYPGANLYDWVTASDRVDCAQFSKKLDSCTEDLLFLFKPTLKLRMDKLRNPEGKKHFRVLLKEGTAGLRSSLKAQCRTSTSTEPANAGALINNCLKKPTCEKFATCFVDVIKIMNE